MKWMLFGCWLFSIPLLAQFRSIDRNLIPNSSFENYRKEGKHLTCAIPWANFGTVDWYTKPIEDDTTAEKGAHSGYCYAGMRFQRQYREYMIVKLAESLHRGYKYKYEFFIRQAYWSNASIKSLGIYFSKVPFVGNSVPDKAFLEDTVCKKGGFQTNYRWVPISGEYTAAGGEKYIAIGNFGETAAKDLIRDNAEGLAFREAYYFVDDVSLKRITKEEEVKTVIVESSFDTDTVMQLGENLKVGEKFELKDIQFEKNHYYLRGNSFSELNKLAQYLFRHPQIEVRINGHSDNSGMEYKNQRLSELRAREVFEYLISKGVQNKMYFKGFGSKMPIADNNTDIGMAKNRRVEVEIIKNE